MVPIRVAIIGASGSIGTQTLQVLADAPDRFRLVAYAVGRTGPSVQGIEAEHPHARCIVGRSGDALSEAVLAADPDLVVAAASGLAGIQATIDALDADVAVAIANKESIVAGGALVIDAARAAASRRRSTLLERLRPIDSEHSALWQCLAGESIDRVERLWLTASGGPLRTWDASRIARAQIRDVLNHPTWKMGGKITVDSATLVNKGLEVIEAHRLYEVPMDRISVAIHPQSVVHGAVSFVDGSIKAQLGAPDMRVPISYALNHPDRGEATSRAISLTELKDLTFESPDLQRFPGLAVALGAGEAGGAAPATLIVADDVAVSRFLAEEIPFGSIPALLRDACERFGGRGAPQDVEELYQLRDEVHAYASGWVPD